VKLLLVAHGSRDPRYAASYETLCDELRRQGYAARVGHLGLCGPDVVEAARLLAREGADAPLVAVPMFLNHGYHVAHDVPEVVAAARDAVSQRILVTEPLGPDPQLVEAMESRLRELGVWPGDPDTAVVLASAGTSDAAARGVLESAAADWARTGWHSVSPAYAGAAAPGAAEAVGAARAAGARDVVIASYFLAPGLLADRVATGAPGIRMAAPFATPADVDPALTRLLLRRAAAVLDQDPQTQTCAGRPRSGIRSGSALRR
jgi:sirohydrochlorin ferrochelatase